MAEESKKGGARSAASVAYLRASSDDRKLPAPPAGTGPAAAAAWKITLKSVDMKEEMQQEVFDCARVAFEKYTVEKGVAEYIKKEFDKKHGPTWHCVVGRNFGSYVTHEANHFIYFYVDSQAVLLFKSG